ncbi:Nucleoporin NUP84 [Spathaspora sp. JA1]|nr:Nucleoporin NUP84 [Spathaspora sp. JA1]
MREHRLNSIVVPYDQETSVEIQFASALQEFQLNKGENFTPFEFLTEFKTIAAKQALQLGRELNENESDKLLLHDFECWDLETKLWNLVEGLYSLRLSQQEEEEQDLLPEYDFSTLAVKQENYLRRNPKIRELMILINWIQTNTKTFTFDENTHQIKWNNTRLAINSTHFNALARNDGGNSDLVVDLDVDAPLRTNKLIDPQDEQIDSLNFSIIYKLLLAGRIQEAIDYANSTGNFALALILVGASQEYIDPVLDGISDSNNNVKSGGIKHKLSWKRTVYKLSQQANLNQYERLIYNYLSGGDITENLKLALDSWEESLLLYATQLLLYKLETFISSLNPQEALSIDVPKPQVDSIDEILNNLSNTNTEISQQSLDQIRIISGAVMIDQVPSLLHKLISQDTTFIDQHLLRILTHLSIFLYITTPSVNPQDLTTIITLYVAKLTECKAPELIPIYLSFMPDEKDARETYSLYLASLTDREQRMKQLEMSKKIIQPVIADDEMMIIDDSQGAKLINVLRRTVERVMNETAEHYIPHAPIIVEDDINSVVDEVDFKLYRAVEWFFDNKMYGDAISATIIIIRRFLICGKLTALKQFAMGKDFNQLLSDYDLQNLRETEEDDIEISEDTKEELKSYVQLLQGLNFIDEWKEFTRQDISWSSPMVTNCLEKVTGTLHKLMLNWFKSLIKTSENTLVYQNIRAIYIPYLIMELLQVYTLARAKDWKYIKFAFELINDVANEEYDYLQCFTSCGRLNEFLTQAGHLAVTASERGTSGIFI